MTKSKLKCAWCGRPQPYGPESTTESGKNICYECSYDAPCFTRGGETIYRDRPEPIKVTMVKAKYRLRRCKSAGGAWGYAVVTRRGREVYWDTSRYEAQTRCRELNEEK